MADATSSPGTRTVAEGESADPSDHATTTEGGLAYSFRAFRHRGFTLFWFAAIFTQTGTWMANIAVPIVVFLITQSPLWVGIAAAAQYVPNALVAPWGGAIADRFPRKWVLLVTQFGMGTAAFSMWLLWFSGVHEVWALLVPLMVQGAMNGVNMPAWQSFVNDLVPRQDLRSAIAFNSVQFNLGRAIGPVIAGILLAFYDPATAFLVNALSFVTVPLALFFIKPLNPQPKVRGVRPLRDFITSTGIIARTRELRLAVVLAISMGFFGNPLFNLTVVFGDEVYHVDSFGVSMLGTALGLGAIIAAPFVSGWSSSMSLERTTRFGLWLYVVTLAVLSAIPNYVTGIIALALSGAAFLAVQSSANTALQINAPAPIRGRVISARIVLFTVSLPIGALAQSAIAETFGVRWSTLVAAVGFLVVALVLDFPRRRGTLSRLDYMPPEEA